ncbi:MAG: phosphotransferase [Candidatus Magasanikbacteria bacterium]|nr:phosphotransferase [Candidatus Magasanikbacteria bacterium]
MTPQKALIHYPLGRVSAITPISVGLIHETYHVEAIDPSTGKIAPFILQRLHTALASPSVTEDYFAITEHLAAAGVTTQRVLRTKTGEITLTDDVAGRRWRLMVFVPGQVFSVVDSAARARAVGASVGVFHGALANLKYKFKSKLALHPYDTSKFYKDFVRVTKKFAKDLLMTPDIRRDVDFLLAEIPKLALPAGLSTRIVHGDLKITNFVFDETGKNVRAIIDLDTCARFPVLLELGDALRSWCGHVEDDPRNKFDGAKYRAAVEGYIGAAPRGFLSAHERKLLPRAVKLIILNLASRFLKDYFEDSYFGFDTKKYSTRRAANLARARGQIALYRDAVKKLA